MSTQLMPRRIEFVLSLPLSATTDSDAEGGCLREMLAHAAVRALAGKRADELAGHIVVVDDLWTTVPAKAG